MRAFGRARGSNEAKEGETLSKRALRLHYVWCYAWTTIPSMESMETSVDAGGIAIHGENDAGDNFDDLM